MYEDLIMVRANLVRKLGGDIPGACAMSVIHHRGLGLPFEEENLRWVKISLPELGKALGISPTQAGRVVRKLVDQGVLHSRVKNDAPNDRTRSYAINVQPWYESE